VSRSHPSRLILHKTDGSLRYFDSILGSIGVGFFYSWNLALVGLGKLHVFLGQDHSSRLSAAHPLPFLQAPCLILIPAGYFEIRYLEKFETVRAALDDAFKPSSTDAAFILQEGEKPLGRATSYATDVVDASKVRCMSSQILSSDAIADERCFLSLFRPLPPSVESLESSQSLTRCSSLTSRSTPGCFSWAASGLAWVRR
jgi:hypothetical protein